MIPMHMLIGVFQAFLGMHTSFLTSTALLGAGIVQLMPLFSYKGTEVTVNVKNTELINAEPEEPWLPYPWKRPRDRVWSNLG